MLEPVITSTLAFISTNIDDIFVIMLYFGTKRFTKFQVVFGQYAGIMALVSVSLAISLIGKIIDPRYVGLLGLFPIYLAIRQFIELYKNKHSSTGEIEINQSNIPVVTIAGVTISNGSDNIGVYVPLLSEFNNLEKTTLVIIFAVMTMAWCYLGMYLAKHPFMAKSIERYGHIIMPIVFLFIGGYILFESEALTLFSR